MTPPENAILKLIDAAETAGYTAVAEESLDGGPPRSVDVRVMDNGRTRAAIRVHLEAGAWRYEVPARVGGQERIAVRTRYLAPARGPLPRGVFRDLGHYFARAVGEPAGPRPVARPEDTPAWMRPGFWESRGLLSGVR